MEKIKVIVFEIFPKFGKTLIELLKSIPFVEFVENDVNNTEEALELVYSQKPDVIILGNDFPGIDGYYFTQIIRQEAAPTQIIMIAEMASAESVRQAMRAGACDFISYKKLSVEEVTLALEHAGKLAHEERKSKLAPKERTEPAPQKQIKPAEKRPAKTIAVYSPKGGVGVSTITANLACVLSSNDHKVLVVDADFLFGDMEVLLNQRSNNSIADLVRYKDNLDEDVIKIVITHGKVDLIAAPSTAEESVEITGPVFEKIFSALSNLDYDYVLINTGSYLSDSTIMALDKAETLILVGTQEISSIRALHMFLNLIGTLRIHPEKLLLVINRFENNAILTKDRLKKRLEMDVSHIIPQDYGTVLLANNLGVPFVTDKNKLPISQSIVELANIIKKGNVNKFPNIAKAFEKAKKSLTITRKKKS